MFVLLSHTRGILNLLKATAVLSTARQVVDVGAKVTGIHDHLVNILLVPLMYADILYR